MLQILNRLPELFYVRKFFNQISTVTSSPNLFVAKSQWYSINWNHYKTHSSWFVSRKRRLKTHRKEERNKSRRGDSWSTDATIERSNDAIHLNNTGTFTRDGASFLYLQRLGLPEATTVNFIPTAKRETSVEANERNIKEAVTRNKTKGAGMWTPKGWVVKMEGIE